MEVADLPLEERLLLAISRFAKEQDGIYDAEVCTEPYVGEAHPTMIVRFSSLDGRGHFMALIEKKEDGSLSEPLYLSGASTPIGDHYERFCTFIARPPYSIASRPRE